MGKMTMIVFLHVYTTFCVLGLNAQSGTPYWTYKETRIQAETTLNTQMTFTFNSTDPQLTTEWRHQTSDGDELVVYIDNHNDTVITGPRYTDRVEYIDDPDSASIIISDIELEDGGLYTVDVAFDDDASALQAEVLLRVYTAEELQSELDNIQVIVNGEVLPPGGTPELESSDVTISVNFLGGLAPDLLSDIRIKYGLDYPITCAMVRNCSTQVSVDEEDECDINFFLGFYPSSVIQFPLYSWITGELYAALLWTTEFILLLAVCGGLVAVIVIVVPIVVVKCKKKNKPKASTTQREHVTFENYDDNGLPSYAEVTEGNPDLYTKKDRNIKPDHGYNPSEGRDIKL